MFDLRSVHGHSARRPFLATTGFHLARRPMLCARKSLRRNKCRCDERPASQAMDLARNGEREETSPDEARQDAAIAAAPYLKLFCNDAGTRVRPRDLGR